MKTKKHTQRGFTIVELLISISVFAMLAGAILVTFSGSRNQVVIEDAQATIINAFEQARSRAATGVGTESHGVIISENSGKYKVITCEGTTTSCTTTDEKDLPFSISVSTDKPPDYPIIFNRLSTKSTSTIITIENTIDGATTTIIITEDGTIISQ